MKENLRTVYYNSRKCLRSADFPNIGHIICYDGLINGDDRDKKDKKDIEETYISISDNHFCIRLHKSSYDTREEFIEKLKILKSEIMDFIDHLNKNK